MWKKVLAAALIAGPIAGCSDSKVTFLSGTAEEAHRAADVAAKAPMGFAPMKSKAAPGKPAPAKTTAAAPSTPNAPK